MESESVDTEKHYKPGFLIGRNEIKEYFLRCFFRDRNILYCPKMNIAVYYQETALLPDTERFFPIFLYKSPENFDEEEYLEALKTKVFGQLTIYTDVLNSSMDIVDGIELEDGLAVITRQQTGGRGRSGNTWLSPEGSALFTLQMHFADDSYLGQNILIVQHLASLAIVSSISSLPGYENLDLRLKWPNDIYFGNSVKIGGVLVTSSTHENVIVCNAGCGLNLNNETPTTCVNKIIQEYNKKTSENLEFLRPEKYFANVFNKLEELVEKVQAGHITEVLELYYKFWLHSDAKITVTDSEGASHDVTVMGIDNNGFIVVRDRHENSFSVHPGENSLDMLNGLIIPKRTTLV